MAVLRPLPNPPPVPPNLATRIAEVRASIETYIDEKVALLKAEMPGLPLGTIRNTLVRDGCECRSYLQLIEKDPK
jgi:hypothetical protein